MPRCREGLQGRVFLCGAIYGSTPGGQKAGRRRALAAAAADGPPFDTPAGSNRVGPQQPKNVSTPADRHLYMALLATLQTCFKTSDSLEHWQWA